MVKIISDSTCDLSKEIVDRYNIDIVPLHVLMGDNEYEDGVNITPDEIIETRAGGVISSHCGPGTLGVLFIDGKN